MVKESVHSANSISSTDLLVDSGASHVVCNKNLLTDHMADPTTINTASNEVISAPGREKLITELPGKKGEINTLTLRHVLWAP